MGKCFEGIDSDLADWLVQQRLLFVATAPLASQGLINCSPKGIDTFRIISPTEVAYLDLTGSGIETASHVKENGRIVFMFCAFAGPPKIVRLHGMAQVLLPSERDFEEHRGRFSDFPGVRAIVRARLTRISDSCGYAIPRYKFVSDRDTLVRWADSKGPEKLKQYRADKNARSLDGLPGIPAGKRGG